jgi:hypothetical protein
MIDRYSIAYGKEMKMDRDRVQLANEFCDMLFSTLSAIGEFPQTADVDDAQLEEPSRLLLNLMAQYDDPEPGFMEWISNMLMRQDGESRMETFPEMMILKKWIIEFADDFDDEMYRHLKASLLGRARQWQFSLRDNIISLAEAEAQWGLQNLRGNAKCRLPMWKIGRNWVTTKTAMHVVYGEPYEEEIVMKKEVSMDGEIYLKLRDVIPALKAHGLKHFAWHPESDHATLHGDVLLATNNAFEAGEITKEQLDLVYEICEPEALR